MHRFTVRLLPSLSGLAAALIVVAVAAFAPAALSQPQLQEGRQFVRLKNAVPVESGNKIEVIEFFSYGCPHCADLEPVLEQWLKSVPTDVQFRRVPVLFQPRWVALARVYYTLEALGVESKLSQEVFNAVHKQGIDLSNDKTFFDWAAKHGLDRKKVEEMYNSFGINGRVNRAKSIGGTYRIESVPTVVVDGKFMTASDKVGSHGQLPAAIDALIAKARAERKS